MLSVSVFSDKVVVFIHDVYTMHLGALELQGASGFVAILRPLLTLERVVQS